MEVIEKMLHHMDLRLMLNLARTNRHYAKIMRDDIFWTRLMREHYAEVYGWCRGILPIFYQANELLGEVLEPIRGQDLEWQDGFDDADIAMPWKRFYLNTRRMYHHPLGPEQALANKRDVYGSFARTFIRLLISEDALWQDGRGRHELRYPAEDSPAEAFFFDDIHLDQDGTYSGVARTDVELSDPNQRARFLELLHVESTLERSIIFGNHHERNEQMRRYVMAAYDAYAELSTAPVMMFRLFHPRVLRLMRQDNSRLIRVFGLVTLDAVNDPVASIGEYADRLISGFFYDCTDMRDFMLCDTDDHAIFSDFVMGSNHRPTDGLRDWALFLLRLML